MTKFCLNWIVVNQTPLMYNYCWWQWLLFSSFYIRLFKCWVYSSKQLNSTSSYNYRTAKALCTTTCLHHWNVSHLGYSVSEVTVKDCCKLQRPDKNKLSDQAPASDKESSTKSVKLGNKATDEHFGHLKRLRTSEKLFITGTPAQH